MSKFKIFRIVVLIMVSFGFLIKGGSVVNAGSGAFDHDSSGVENKNNGGVRQAAIDKYRKYLLEYFELVHGRKIDFGKEKEAEKLYEAVKKFEKENSGVEARNLKLAFVDYVKNNRNHELDVKTVSRSEFEKNFGNGSRFLRLYYDYCFYKKDLVGAFKRGENVTNLRKIQNNDMAKYDDYYLMTSSCKEVFDRSTLWNGPWNFWVGDELAIDLENTKILDLDHLQELVAIAKYKHPVDFGFVKEIEENFDEAAKHKHYDSFEDKKQGRRFFLESYFDTSRTLFNSRDIFIDDLYRKNIGESYFDVLFGRVSDEKALEISEKIKPFQNQIEEFDKANGLFIENYEDFDSKSKIFYVNKTAEILVNEKFLAKLLGYDILFRKYNVNEGEMATWGIAPNPRNGEYYIVDYGCISMVCSDEKTKERNDKGDIIAENMGQVLKRN